MKIAALVQVHLRPDLAAYLLDRLSTPLWNVYVHVDRKTDVAPFAALSDRAVFLRRRKRVFWGGFSQVEATLLLLRRAYRDTENAHFYLMSGQCFPIKSDAEIEPRLRQCGGNFVSMVKMPTHEKPLLRLKRWHCNDVRYGKLHRYRRAFFRRLPERNLDRLLRGMEPWAGSQWWLRAGRQSETFSIFALPGRVLFSDACAPSGDRARWSVPDVCPVHRRQLACGNPDARNASRRDPRVAFRGAQVRSVP